eukprot:jgi/Galph1/5177/GphlegSOOS_G3808.1
MVDKHVVDILLKPDVARAERLEAGNRIVGTVGTVFISETLKNTIPSRDRRRNFLEDLSAYMNEIGRGNFKIPTLGGLTLDVFVLYQEVIRRGGVQHVIDNREFKEISKILRLPKTCTAAAYVLRESYEKILYFYEQKHVFGRNAEDVPPVVQLGARLERAMPSGRSFGSYEAGSVDGSVSQDAHSSEHSLEQSPRASPDKIGLNSTKDKRTSYLNEAVSTPFSGVSALPGNGQYESTQAVRNLVQEEVFVTSRPLSVSFRADIPSERNRLVLSLQSGLEEDVNWALITINSLSYDPKFDMLVRDYPGLLESLEKLLQEYLEDLREERDVGLLPNEEDEEASATKTKMMLAVELNIPNSATTNKVRNPSLQGFGDLFCKRDPVHIKRERTAKCISNAIRNLSLIERNRIYFAKNISLIRTCLSIAVSEEALTDIVYDILDTLKNIAEEVKLGEDTEFLLEGVIELIYDSEGIGDSIFVSKATEIIAKLCFNPDNENELFKKFDEILPLLVNLLNSSNKEIQLAAAGALCNASAFDWGARIAIAKTPSAICSLIHLLNDSDIAPLSAISIMNLSEAPSNRAILMRYEPFLVDVAMKESAAAEPIACALNELADE